MEALKNNDVERYRQILLEQQTSVPGDAAQRYNVLSSFLTQTEEYLYKLGGKITATKSQQQVEEAANAAAAAARAQVFDSLRFGLVKQLCPLLPPLFVSYRWIAKLPVDVISSIASLLHVTRFLVASPIHEHASCFTGSI